MSEYEKKMADGSKIAFAPAKHKDFTIDISYNVYTCDENGKTLRYVGNYPCMCVVKEVGKYLMEKYEVKSNYLKVVDAEAF